MKLEEKAKALLDSALEEKKDFFLVNFSVDSSNAICVVIDGDKGVSIQDCMDISRAIEHSLDREEEDFSLEVTSYGITEPLFLPRQFKKNVGRTLKVKVKDEKEKEGILKDANDTHIVLETKNREPKPVGKGKTTVIREHSIALDTIEKAKLVIKF